MGASSQPDDGPRAAARELQRLVAAFGRDRVLVELWDHGNPLDSVRNDALAEHDHEHDHAHDPDAAE